MKQLVCLYFIFFSTFTLFSQTFVELEQKAKQGDVESMHLLGRYYHNPEGQPIDIKKAVYWYKKAVDLGYARSEHNLALCYIHGHGVDVNVEKAFSLLQSAASKDLLNSIELLYEIYQNLEVYDSCFYWCKKAVEKGSVHSQYRLSLYYEYGIGTEINKHKAFMWALEAAEAGYADAQENVGLFYLEGEVVPQNIEKGLYWLEKAAEQGVTVSLGRLHQMGQYVPLDKKKAFELFKISAELGDRWGQYELANCYRYGKGIKQDKNLAIYWYELSSQAGQEEATKALEEINGGIDIDELKQKNKEYQEWFENCK